MKNLFRLGLLALSLALLAGGAGTAAAKKHKPKPASLTLTVTPNHLKVGQKYTAELKGFAGRFTKLAVDGHDAPCAHTVKAENQKQTIYTLVVDAHKNFDWSLKFWVTEAGTRHVCAYLYDPAKRGDVHQRHKSATYTATR